MKGDIKTGVFRLAAAVIAAAAVFMTACSHDSSTASDSQSVESGEMAALTQNEALPGEETPPGTEALPQTEASPEEEAGGERAGAREAGRIYLYGELHGEEAIIEKEFELWRDHYQKDGMRHLFLETPYYTAEFLNLWMKAEDDEILEDVYADWEGSAAHNPYLKEFYQKIKSECPETVFHGTDVGHQYDTTGKRYLNYLKENQLEQTRQYQIVKEVIEQGKFYYENSDDVYRENKMTENFIREYDSLRGASVMGVYGGAHVGIDAMEYTTQSVPCMANQLYAVYGDMIDSEDLTWMKKDIDPLRIDKITVAGKEYEASYFGKEELTGFKDFSYREFWRLEQAYEDFKDRPKNGNVLPYDNYPMLIETGQVFILEIGKTDGSVERAYYRSDGNRWNQRMSTEEFQAD